MVVHAGMCLVSDHPVCAAKVASRHFLNGAATPPNEEGNVASFRGSLFLYAFIDRRYSCAENEKDRVHLGK